MTTEPQTAPRDHSVESDEIEHPLIALAIKADECCELRALLEKERAHVAKLQSERDQAQAKLDAIDKQLNSGSIANGKPTAERVKVLHESHDELWDRLRKTQKVLDDAGVQRDRARAERDGYAGNSEASEKAYKKLEAEFLEAHGDLDAIAPIGGSLPERIRHATERLGHVRKQRDVSREIAKFAQAEAIQHREARSTAEHDLAQARASIAALTVDMRKYRALYEGQKLETEFAHATQGQLLAEIRKLTAVIAYERAMRTTAGGAS